MSSGKFFEKVRRRLEAGAREYGDSSFNGSTINTIEEIEEELLDVVGWGYILWTKLNRLRGAIVDIEAPLMARTDASIIRVACGTCGLDGWGSMIDDDVLCLKCGSSAQGILCKAGESVFSDGAVVNRGGSGNY